MAFIQEVTGANYSNLGLGKVNRVTVELESLLSSYSTLNLTKAYAIQNFIDDIGGINSNLWVNKITHLLIPFYSITILEALINLKGTSTFNNLPDSQKNINYQLLNGVLSQNDASFGSYSPQLSINTEVYKISQFGIIPEIVGAENYFSSLGDGNVSIPSGTRNLFAQKYDGTNNQFGAITMNPLSKHCYSFSGLQGIATQNQNGLIADGIEVLFPTQPSFNLTKQAPVGSVGNPWGNYSTNRLRGAYLLGYGIGITREESLKINIALQKLATII